MAKLFILSIRRALREDAGIEGEDSKMMLSRYQVLRGQGLKMTSRKIEP